VAGESGGVPASGVFATVVLERLVDALSFLPLMVFALVWLEVPLPGLSVKASLRVGAGLFALADTDSIYPRFLDYLGEEGRVRPTPDRRQT
jgi:hypothetical protein